MNLTRGDVEFLNIAGRQHRRHPVLRRSPAARFFIPAILPTSFSLSAFPPAAKQLLGAIGPFVAIRKFDPEYKKKLKQIVEMIDERFAGRKFTLAAVNRHLEFDAVGHLRLLVSYQYLEGIGKGEFQRTASWPPPAQFFAGQPIGLTYCVQTWFRYYVQQWITSSMGQLESKEGVYSLDCRGEYGGAEASAKGSAGLAIPSTSRRRAGTEGRGRRRSILRRRTERFEIGRGRLRDGIELSEQIAYFSKFHAQRTTIQLDTVGKQGSVIRRLYRDAHACGFRRRKYSIPI